jgi:ankyrin repeat protein
MYQVVMLMLEKGADVNEKNKNGSTALHWATMSLGAYLLADRDVIAFLIENKL